MYTHTRTHTLLYMYMYIYIVYTFMYAPVHIYHIYIFTYVCIHTLEYEHILICIHFAYITHGGVFPYTFVYTCVLKNIHTYTYRAKIQQELEENDVMNDPDF